MGTFASNVGLAVADLAKQRKVLFLAAEPLTDKIVWENGNRYTFRLRASTYMQTAMLAPEAAKLGKKRWAIVYPNYEYGQSATAAFKKQMIALQAGGIEFVEQAVPLGKIDAGPGRAGAARRQAGRDLLVAVRPRPRALRPRGRAARPVQGPAGVQPAGRRARVPRPAEGRGAGRLVGDRLPVVRDRDARAQALPRRVPGEVQRLSAPRARSSATARSRPRPRRSARRARPTPRSSSPR